MQEIQSKSNQEIVAVQTWLVNKLAEQLSLNPSSIETTEPLTRYGLDSIDAVTIVGDLEDWLDLELPSTLFWDYPTLEKAAAFLAENYDLSGALNASKTEAETTPTKPEPVAASSGKAWGNLLSRFGGK